MRSWLTWDEPDQNVAVAQWRERDIRVVFPLPWAAVFGQRAMIVRAQERIRFLEGQTGRTVVPGSVLLAFSRHTPGPRVDPDVPQHLLPVTG